MKKFMKKMSGVEGSEGMRLPIPHSMPENWRTLMRKCWDPDPDMRPSFETIKLSLNNIWEEWQIVKPEKYEKKFRKPAEAITASIVDFGRTISDDTGQLTYKANLIDRSSVHVGGDSEDDYELEKEKEGRGLKESRQERRRRRRRCVLSSPIVRVFPFSIVSNICCQDSFSFDSAAHLSEIGPVSFMAPGMFIPIAMSAYFIEY